MFFAQLSFHAQFSSPVWSYYLITLQNLIVYKINLPFSYKDNILILSFIFILKISYVIFL